jgi:hypothetical protein
LTHDPTAPRIIHKGRGDRDGHADLESFSDQAMPGLEPGIGRTITFLNAGFPRRPAPEGPFEFLMRRLTRKAWRRSCPIGSGRPAIRRRGVGFQWGAPPLLRRSVARTNGVARGRAGLATLIEDSLLRRENDGKVAPGTFAHVQRGSHSKHSRTGATVSDSMRHCIIARPDRPGYSPRLDGRADGRNRKH